MHLSNEICQIAFSARKLLSASTVDVLKALPLVALIERLQVATTFRHTRKPQHGAGERAGRHRLPAFNQRAVHIQRASNDRQVDKMLDGARAWPPREWRPHPSSKRPKCPSRASPLCARGPCHSPACPRRRSGDNRPRWPPHAGQSGHECDAQASRTPCRTLWGWGLQTPLVICRHSLLFAIGALH
jgi:hypothetical protein